MDNWVPILTPRQPPFFQPQWNGQRDRSRRGQNHKGGRQPCQQCGSMAHRVCTLPNQDENFEEILRISGYRVSANLCPERYERSRDIRKTQQMLLATNGSRIEVIGQAHVTLKVDNMNFRVPVLITPQLNGLLLGLGWVSAKGAILDLS